MIFHIVFAISLYIMRLEIINEASYNHIKRPPTASLATSNTIDVGL